MEIKFEGDIKALTEATKDICRKTLQDKGFTNCIVKVEAVCKKGDNYGANVRRFIAQQEGVNNGETFKMVGKLAPINEQVRKMIGTETAFSNEIIVYDKLFPKYNEIQNQANIKDVERLKFPKCYGVCGVPPTEIILLEDVEETGFFPLGRMNFLTDDQVKTTLGALAKFHALSYVLKIKRRQFYDNIKKELINLAIRAEFEYYLVTCEDETQNMLRNESYRKRVKGLVANIVKSGKVLHDYDFNADNSAIIHGDCWTNNMMYRIQDTEPISIRMLDFQITRIATPPADVFYFILNSSNYETRHNNYSDWLDYYYDCFTEFLLYFDLESNKIYSREIFDKDLKRTAASSIGLAIMLSKLVVREAEDITDYKETGLIPASVNATKIRDIICERFNLRVEGIVKFCTELKLI